MLGRDGHDLRPVFGRAHNRRRLGKFFDCKNVTTDRLAAIMKSSMSRVAALGLAAFTSQRPSEESSGRIFNRLKGQRARLYTSFAKRLSKFMLPAKLLLKRGVRLDLTQCSRAGRSSVGRLTFQPRRHGVIRQLRLISDNGPVNS